MKLLSFVVPCYNSEEYLARCVESLLPAGEDAEIIIINDGSADRTRGIAEDYAKRFPEIITVINKENGGHGSCVNLGLRRAQGLYFKVVDSDDRLDSEALKKLINTVKRHISGGQLPDLYVTNFVYDRVSDGKYFIRRFGDKLPKEQLFTWDSVKRFRFSEMMIMHSLVFRRDVLIESGVILPEHAYYVDNLFAYAPLPFVKTLFYIDCDLYRYLIGRGDQSVNRAVFGKRYDQQIRVMLCMADAYSWAQIKGMPSGLRRYMRHSLSALMMITLTFTCAGNDKERRAALKVMWRHIRLNDRALYKKLRYRSYAASVNFMPWRLRAFALNQGYKILCKRIKLG